MVKIVKTETKTYKRKISGLFCDMCAKELGDDIILASRGCCDLA